MPKGEFDAIIVKYKKLGAKALTIKQKGVLVNEIIDDCSDLLSKFNRVPLVTKIAHKSYFAFTLDGKKISRAINEELFTDDLTLWPIFIEAIEKDKLSVLNKDDINKILYTAAISFCASVDLFKVGDQKTPGTFFEYYIAYLFTLCIKVAPVTSIKVLDFDGRNTMLQTDNIFNLGIDKPKFHLPIKTSSRERAIMLWAHQRLLDGVYGIEKFMGTPVLLAETKTDITRKEVTEICLPDQWVIYQLYIARLKRIYYLDIPESYRKLNLLTPPIYVKPFSEFFFEWAELTA
jgi:hypothetical protein